MGIVSTLTEGSGAAESTMLHLSGSQAAQCFDNDSRHLLLQWVLGQVLGDPLHRERCIWVGDDGNHCQNTVPISV
jgi:hypothetical protein